MEFGEVMFIQYQHVGMRRYSLTAPLEWLLDSKSCLKIKLYMCDLFLKIMPLVGTNGLWNECHRQGRGLVKY